MQKLRHQHAASTHKCTGTRSQLHGSAKWVGPDAAQPLTPRSAHLRSPTAPSAHRGAPGAPSRPKSMVTAREDRVEDGLPTVEVAQVVELVGIRDGEATPSRPIGGGPLWSCRGGSALPRNCDPCQLSAAAPMRTAPWRAHTQGGRVCAREGCSCSHPHRRERQGSQPPAISAGHLAKKEAFQRGRWTAPRAQVPAHDVLRSRPAVVAHFQCQDVGRASSPVA